MGRCFHAVQSVFLLDLGKQKAKMALGAVEKSPSRPAILTLSCIYKTPCLLTLPLPYLHIWPPAECKGPSLVAPDLQMKKPKHGEVK